MNTFNESLLPSNLMNLIKKIVKNPIKAGIAAFLIYNILKPSLTKKENISISTEESYIKRLEDVQAQMDNWTTSKMVGWVKGPNYTKEEPAFYNKDKKILLYIKKKPYKNKKGATEYNYFMLKNGKVLNTYSNIKDANMGLDRNMRRFENFSESGWETIKHVMSAKNISAEPMYEDKMKDKWGKQQIFTVKIRPMIIDGEKFWFVIRNKKAALFVQKPKTGTELSSHDFESSTYQRYMLTERQMNRLKLKI